MTDTKFTPAPWAAIDHGVGELVVYEPSTDKCICSFDDSDKHYAWKENYSIGGEAAANAHLIAAAPDMYEALADLVHDFEGQPGFGPAKKALARARGES